MSNADWNPALYGRFTGLRLRPAIDLLSQIRALSEGDVVDLGCGAGAVAGALRARFPDRHLLGVDSSAAMLDEAGESGLYDGLIEGDATEWQSATPPALIFSNALCHWLPDHPALFARLAAMLAPGRHARRADAAPIRGAQPRASASDRRRDVS